MNPFNLAAINFAWLPILPLIMVAVGAIAVLLSGVRLDDDESEGLGWLSLATLAVAFVLTLGLVGQTGDAFAGSLAIDGFSAFFELMIIIAAAFTILMSLDYAGENHLPGAEVEPAAAAGACDDAGRVWVQSCGGAVPYVDARRVRGRSYPGDRVHGSWSEVGRIRRVRADLPGQPCAD
jgi:hypothetical protein